MSGTDDSQPKYREAYPRLDILQATAAYRRGETLCIFRNEQGRVLGAVRFSFSASGALLRGELGGPSVPYWAGVERLILLGAANDLPKVHRILACPKCGGRVQVLFCAAAWGCAACHGLHFRRQLIDRQTRDAEDLAEAELRLKKPRPKGMHQKTFAAFRAADTALVQRLRPVVDQGWRRVASAEHQARVSETWMPFETARRSPELSLMIGLSLDEIEELG